MTEEKNQGGIGDGTQNNKGDTPTQSQTEDKPNGTIWEPVSGESSKEENSDKIDQAKEEKTESLEQDKVQNDQEAESSDSSEKKVKNLVSIVVLLIGMVAGSMMVDVAQFFAGEGYSPHALENVEAFTTKGKSWVAFSDPIVEVKILTVKEEEMEDCEACDPTEVVSWLKKIAPTIVAKNVNIDSKEGEKLIEEFGIKTIPAFIFSKEVEDTEFYQEGGPEIDSILEEDGDSFVLNTAAVGIPAGKFLVPPSVTEQDAIQGNLDAKVRVVVFSDFQCPYCANYYKQIQQVAAEFGDDVALVYKDMPLQFHQQAPGAALAARCAQEQGKFWEAAELLYSTQKEWGAAKDNEVFKGYANQVGLEGERFSQCIDEGRYDDLVQKDFEEARAFGVAGTPTTFVNKEILRGVSQPEEIKAAIQEELDK